MAHRLVAFSFIGIWIGLVVADMDILDADLVEVRSELQIESGRAALLTRAGEGVGDAELGALLRALAARLEHGLNCLALIGDPLHQAMFGRAFYKRLGSIPVFKVLVQENEDLLSPNYRTLKVIRQVRKEGCRAYFLLFANGVQLSRLLRFGDSHRVLDTRARFVLLFDRRLIGVDLHYLWKKIVNVVFVRRFGGPWASSSAAGRRSSWFELSTVPFPAPIHGVLVPRRLDIWRRGAFRQNIDLFRDKTSDLQNQTLSVVTFQHVPASYRAAAATGTARDDSQDNGFSGLEVQVMQALARAMNFMPRLYEAPNAEREQWGRRQLDGSMSGLLGEATAGRAELVLGDLHYTPYHLELLDLSVPYHVECLTFLTPESTTDNSWQTLILPFKPGVWLAVGLALLVGGMTFFLLARVYAHLQDVMLQPPDSPSPERNLAVRVRPKRFTEALVRLGAGMRRLTNLPRSGPGRPGAGAAEQKSDSSERLAEEVPAGPARSPIHLHADANSLSPPRSKTGLHLFAQSLGSAMLYTLGMLLGVSLPRIPTGWALRVMTGWWWLYSILVVVAYRAAMTAILANPAPRITIDSLEQLADSVLSVGGWGEHQKEFFETSLDEAGQKVGRRFEVTSDWRVAVERVAQGSFAYYENSHFLRYAEASRRRKALSRADDTSQESGAENGLQPANSSSARSGSDMSPPAPAGNASDGRPGGAGTANGTDSGVEASGARVQNQTERNLHIMRDCVINMPISLGLQKNSALKPRVDRFLRRVIEAGLVHKWLADAMLATTSTGGGSGANEEPIKALMELRKLYGALVALGAGYALSALTLAVELVWYHGVTARRVGFDIYAENRGLKASHDWHRN